MACFVIEVSDTDLPYLQQLIADGQSFVAGDVRELLEHLARSAADGVRRPGSWEREWITQATGFVPPAVPPWRR